MRYIISIRENVLSHLEKIILSAKDGDELIVSQEILKLYATGIVLTKRPSLILKVLVDEPLCNSEEKASINTQTRRHALSKKKNTKSSWA
jgi:hypothetical protein